MAILTAMQSASRKLIGQSPSAFFGGSGAFELEIADLINEVAQDIAKYQDWQALIRIAEITGDGSTTEFALPSDYDRMLLKSDVATLNTWFWGYGAFLDINAFMQSEARGFTPFPGGWIIYANQLRFSPAPVAAQPASFPYITKKWAIAENLSPKAEFTADSDSFVLPERLLMLGLVWRWRENKRIDATGDQEAFVKALDEYGGKDRGSRIQRRSARGGFPGTYPAWPWELGPATY